MDLAGEELKELPGLGKDSPELKASLVEALALLKEHPPPQN